MNAPKDAIRRRNDAIILMMIGWNTMLGLGGMEWNTMVFYALIADEWRMMNDEALSSCPNVQIIMYRYVTSIGDMFNNACVPYGSLQITVIPHITVTVPYYRMVRFQTHLSLKSKQYSILQCCRLYWCIDIAITSASSRVVSYSYERVWWWLCMTYKPLSKPGNLKQMWND